MAWQFGDGFDLYAAVADPLAGYWDSGNTTTFVTLVTGRFAGSRAIQISNAASLAYLTKSSGSNDAIHHITIAYYQSLALSGTNALLYIQLLDGTTNQCCIVFRSDGAIVLTAGLPNGAALATYTGAVSAQNTWFAFEIEVFISATAGYMNVRKNGNTSNDFASATNLNTRNGTTNAYANKITLGNYLGSSGNYIFDDLLWRSDAASVPWVGDIRCYTRMPASDAAVQFSRTPTSNTQTPYTTSSNPAIAAGTVRYTSFVAAYDGTIGTAILSLGTGYTGNMKCSLFASAVNLPTTVLGSATVLTNPIAGANTITFGTPVTVTKGTLYWIGFDSDTSSGTWGVSAASVGLNSTTPYASFPVASPSCISAGAAICSLTITVGSNATVVNEPQQDAATTYVYDSTPGDADFYGIAAIASTPVATIAVTTRGYMQKSDAGTRTAAVQLKSGSATVASSTLVLTTSGWQWAWRTDTVDPNTSAAWTAAAVNNAQIGPKTVA